ncbi:MAG: MFS transporter [Acetobacteraceae bacterium]|nr:MFS transporter [Acetobacteraceae bacterium]
MFKTANAQIIYTVALTFIVYLMIGLPLAVLPPYVHDRLGFGSVMSGLVISAQYLATLANRAQAGRMADTAGPKRAVLTGLVTASSSGVFLLVASLLAGTPSYSLGSLLVSRILLGFGESWVATGAIMWAIGLAGATHTSKVMSWNGVASYGAIAVGAPLGVALDDAAGLPAIAVAVLALGVVGFAWGWPRRPVATVPGKRLSFRVVFWRVLPHGTSLALGTAGFGTIATFVTLYYASRDWSGAALCLSVFGACFISVRLLFAGAISRWGGFPTALLSFAVETAGLLLLWAAANPATALLGSALTGCGFSLVFPAIGVEVVALVPPTSRGAAIGAFTVFFDVALGFSGPIAGAIAHGRGYPATFLFSATCTAIAVLVTLGLYLRGRNRPDAAAR